MSLIRSLIVSAGLAAFALSPAVAQDAGMKKWTKGKGWGWVWGPEDEVGALNEMTDASRLAALQLVRQGKSYDLGLAFTTPEGGNAGGTAWHSNALFISDNVATQIDGLGHITHGADNHFYNGFKAGEWGGDFGLRQADVTTIPPVIARGVLIDVAGYKKLDALPAHYEITVEDLEGALKAQNIDVTPGSVVLVRTGTARYWGQNGSDHAKIGEHDSAGIGLKAAKWLVEQKGALMVGADTSGLEYVPPKPEDSQAMGGSFNPVHVYLLVEQGVHILEFNNLEQLAADRAYEFAYILSTNAIRGTVAGTALRPIALR
jgi:kynurenine formamidase